MIIHIDENNNIVSLITLGGLPDDPSYIRLNRDDVPVEILEHIYDYKYIDGEFIRQDNPDEKYISKVLSKKLSVLSSNTNYVIENGIDFNGEHYSLTQEDQMNLTNLSMMAEVLQNVPYHADGKLCRMYTSEEIKALATSAIMWITFHTTYYNFLKAYCKTLSLSDLIQVHYGILLPNEYMEQIQTIIGMTIDIEHFLVNIPDNTDYDRITGKVNIDEYIWEEDQPPAPEPEPEPDEGDDEPDEEEEDGPIDPEGA
jgi:hypothetical protein